MDYANQPELGKPIIGFNESSARSARQRQMIAMLVAGALLLIAAVGVVGVQLFKHNNAATAISSVMASATIAPTGVNPTTIQVKQNQPVTWTNQDVHPHRLTADQTLLPGFDTVEVLNQGDSYTYVFETKGTYHYYDPADPTAFVGTVIVQ